MSRSSWTHSLAALLPAVLRGPLKSAAQAAAAWKNGLELACLRERLASAKPGDMAPCAGYRVRINDPANFYVMFKDIFVRRIYHFEATRPDPRILDCGSNIGISILYFKQTYPQSRITGFEPDPAVFPYLEENVRSNDLKNVQVRRIAIGGREGSIPFHADSPCGSHIANPASSPPLQAQDVCDVPVQFLRNYLDESVDFLKMNIEGAEWEALSHSEDRIRQIREMAIEYHHLPGLPRTLHEILGLLHRNGFETLVNDFDSESNAAVRPPFVLNPDTRYFLLIYAHRMD